MNLIYPALPKVGWDSNNKEKNKLVNMSKSFFQKNKLLSKQATFKIGGRADFFKEVQSEEELKEVLNFVTKNNYPFFILGGGSNILINDDGFRGVVLKIKIVFSKILKENNKFIEIEIGSGISLATLVLEMAKKGWSGLEWMAGIPGTVGGAVFGNAGAYGHSISESIIRVKAINKKTGSKKIFLNNKCKFKYRESYFKKSDWIIISVFLKLNKEKVNDLMDTIKDIILFRNKKIPHQPSAGCVFKNILVADLNNKCLKKIPKEIIKGGKLPAGWLIEQCGLKGRQLGEAEISNLHANFIINLGGAKAKDVFNLINLCKQKVLEKFEINLEEEIILIGF